METKIIELGLANKSPLSVEEGVLYRMTLPLETQVAAPKEDETTGDVTFSAIAVDKNRKANRRGLIFDWDSPEDVDVKNFLANPVMLFSHDQHLVPIGRWEGLEITSKAVKLDGRIPGGPDYEDLRPIRVRVRDGYMKAVSIGFYILRSEEDKDKNGNLIGIRVKSFELVECSPCSIGAHETAIISGKKERQSLGLPTDMLQWKKESDEAQGIIRLSLIGPTEQTEETEETEESPKEGCLQKGEPDTQGSGVDIPPLPLVDEQLDGRVLSKKTRDIMNKAAEACSAATLALRTLLNEADKDKDKGKEKDEDKDDQTPPPPPTPTEPPEPDSASVPASTVQMRADFFESIIRETVLKVLSDPELLKVRAERSEQVIEVIAAHNRQRRKAYYHGK